MIVIVVVLVIAVVSAIAAGLLAWRLPNFDPAAPRASSGSIAEEVIEHPGLRGVLRSRLDSSALTGLALTIALTIVLVGIIAAGSVLVMVQHDAGLARYDLGAARWGATNATSTSTRFLRN